MFSHLFIDLPRPVSVSHVSGSTRWPYDSSFIFSFHSRMVSTGLLNSLISQLLSAAVLRAILSTVLAMFSRCAVTVKHNYLRFPPSSALTALLGCNQRPANVVIFIPSTVATTSSLKIGRHTSAYLLLSHCRCCSIGQVRYRILSAVFRPPFQHLFSVRGLPSMVSTGTIQFCLRRWCSPSCRNTHH